MECTSRGFRNTEFKETKAYHRYRFKNNQQTCGRIGYLDTKGLFTISWKPLVLLAGPKPQEDQQNGMARQEEHLYYKKKKQNCIVGLGCRCDNICCDWETVEIENTNPKHSWYKLVRE
eukprot:GHVO01032321.1.p1 GENE.GHVO01032321.1~~GHVO01032321.1.p1  ORF type:complete len:118 (-),score=4.87 GHVO01032321.1:172-525(-)